MCASLEAHLDKEFLADCVEFYNSVKATISQFPNHCFEPLFSTAVQKTIELTDSVTVNGTFYKKVFFVIVERDGQGYVFGNIDTIVCDNPLKPVLMLNFYGTKYFDNHLYA